MKINEELTKKSPFVELSAIHVDVKNIDKILEMYRDYYKGYYTTKSH